MSVKIKNYCKLILASANRVFLWSNGMLKADSDRDVTVKLFKISSLLVLKCLQYYT